MSFEHATKVSRDRIGVLVGRNGRVKQVIEEECKVRLEVNSATGEVRITSSGDVTEMQPFKAVSIVSAIARGFSPERAFRLRRDDVTLQVIDLRDYVGRAEQALTRIKGRIIGLGGKSRRLIEELTGTDISVYGRTVSLIGSANEVRMAADAVDMLASGSTHKAAYRTLQRARTKAKLERMKLWEGQPIG